MVLNVYKDQTDQLSLIEVGNEFVLWSDHWRHLFGKFYQPFNCCNILLWQCTFNHISRYYNTAWICLRVDLLCMPGIPTVHVLPMTLWLYGTYGWPRILVHFYIILHNLLAYCFDLHINWLHKWHSSHTEPCHDFTSTQSSINWVVCINVSTPLWCISWFLLCVKQSN